MLPNAIKLHQAHQLDAAKNIYLEILNKEPNNYEVLHLLGILHAQQKDFQNAKEFLIKALELKKDSAILHNNFGNVLRNLQQFSDALIHYNLALKFDENNFAAENNLGITFYQLENFDTAIKHYKNALKINPDFFDAYFNLGLALFKINDIANAIKNFKLAIAINPVNAEVHFQLALSLQQQNDLESALKHYIKTLRLNSTHAKAHNNLAGILKIKNKFQSAISHYKKALSLDPNNLESYYNLGITYLEQNEPQIALKYFFYVAKKTPEFNVFYNLGVTYLNLNQNSDAINYFHEALKFQPQNLNTHINLAAAYLKLEDFTNAAKHYESILNIDPTNAEAKYLLAAINKDTTVKSAPSEYLQNLFDQYASSFDKHLAALQYSAPQIIFDTVNLLTELHANSLTILDLGCGTGLCAEKFRHFAKRLIGLDLSSKMLNAAREKNVFDELYNCDINNDFVHLTAVDLIIAADSLVYIGDLANIFSNARKTLVKQGLFVFTIEHTNIYPYTLQSSARFAHTKNYILELATKNNFALLTEKNVKLRMQRNVAIMGYVYAFKALAFF